jgi:hypothetical protein
MLGLNLHDQGRMTTVGNTGHLASNSVLAVSGDAENTLTRGRLRSKRACAAIVEAIAPFIPGGLAEDDLASCDPQIYEDLPENQTDSWSDVVVRGGYVLQPGATEVFRSDLAFNYLHSGREAAGCCGHTRIPSQIFLLGDASCHGAGTSVEPY